MLATAVVSKAATSSGVVVARLINFHLKGNEGGRRGRRTGSRGLRRRRRRRFSSPSSPSSFASPLLLRPKLRVSSGPTRKVSDARSALSPLHRLLISFDHWSFF